MQMSSMALLHSLICVASWVLDDRLSTLRFAKNYLTESTITGKQQQVRKQEWKAPIRHTENDSKGHLQTTLSHRNNIQWVANVRVYWENFWYISENYPLAAMTEKWSSMIISGNLNIDTYSRWSSPRCSLLMLGQPLPANNSPGKKLDTN